MKIKRLMPQIRKLSYTIREFQNGKEHKIQEMTIKALQKELEAYESAVILLRILLSVKPDKTKTKRGLELISAIQIFAVKLLGQAFSIKTLILNGYYTESLVISRNFIETYLTINYIGWNSKRLQKWFEMNKTPKSHWSTAELIKGLEKTAYPRMISKLSEYVHSKLGTIEEYLPEDKQDRMIMFPPFYKQNTAKNLLIGGFQDVMFATLILENYFYMFKENKITYRNTRNEIWKLMGMRKIPPLP